MRRLGLFFILLVMVISTTSCLMYGNFSKSKLNQTELMEKYVPSPLTNLEKDCMVYTCPWQEHPIYGSWIKFFNIKTQQIDKKIPLQGVRSYGVNSLLYGNGKYFFRPSDISHESTMINSIKFLDETTGIINSIPGDSFSFPALILDNGNLFNISHINNTVEMYIKAPPKYQEELFYTYIKPDSNSYYWTLFQIGNDIYFSQTNNNKTPSLTKFNLITKKIDTVWTFYDTARDFMYYRLSNDKRYTATLKYDFLDQQKLNQGLTNQMYILDLQSNSANKIYKQIDLPGANDIKDQPATEIASPSCYYNIFEYKDNIAYVSASISGYKNNAEYHNEKFYQINTQNGSTYEFLSSDKNFCVSKMCDNLILMNLYDIKSKKYSYYIYNIENKKFTLENFDLEKAGE